MNEPNFRLSGPDIDVTYDGGSGARLVRGSGSSLEDAAPLDSTGYWRVRLGFSLRSVRSHW
ncbi:hypothetical protein ACWDKQ_08840 [Saccharopolyspora sp. NPDC000995]